MREKLKKWLSLLMVVMMVAGLVQLPAKTVKAAEGGPTFSIKLTDSKGNEITKAKPGDNIRAVLSTEDAKDLTGGKFYIIYDKTKFSRTRPEGWSQAEKDYEDRVCNGYEDEDGNFIPGTADALPRTVNPDLPQYTVVVWGVANQDPTNTIKTVGTGDIEFLTLYLTVNEEVEGDFGFYIQRTNYFLEGRAKSVVVEESPVLKNTLTVEKPKVPMTGFELNKSALAFDLSGNTTEKLSVASYVPEDTTDKDKTVAWASSAPGVAKVAADGTVTAVGKGTATITATIQNSDGTEISRTCSVTVAKSVTSITVDPTAITLKNGQTRQLTATVAPADADDTSVTWTSSDESVATVDSKGLVKAVAENGTAKITATASNGMKSSCDVTVATKHLESIAVKAATTIGKGDTEKLSVTYSPDLANVTDEVSDVTWTSSDESIAKVAADGTVTAVSKGTATITAAVTADGKTFNAACTVTVNVPLKGIAVSDSNVSLVKGQNKTVSVNLNPSDADADTYNLEWSINNASASIQPSADNKSCTITALKAGDAEVTVKDTISGKTAKVTVKVTEIEINEIQVNVDKKALNKGDVTTAEAIVLPANTTDDKTITWSSDNEAVATVDQDGKITAVGAGKAVIRATSTVRGSVSGTATITVSIPLTSIAIKGDEPLELVKKQTAELEVVYNPADTTVDKSKLTWTSSNAKIASVDENGKVKALKAGTVTITARLDDKVAIKTVKVTEIPLDQIELNAVNKTIDLKEGSFNLQVLYNKGTTDEILSTTWTSSDESVATVDKNGKVTLVGAGDAVITVTMTTDAETNNVFTASCDVKVIIPMTGLKIMKDDKDVTGQTMQLTKDASMTFATLADPENTTDVISSITWKSSDAESVKVDGNGVVTTLKESSKPVTITATATLESGEKVTASIKVSAVEIHIESIALSDAKVTMEAGDTKALTVTYNPENTTDVKEIQTWSSSNPAVATVDENGVITAVKAGTAVITATTANGKSDSCKVTVPLHIDRVTAEDIAMRRGDEPQKIQAVVSPADAVDDKTLEYTVVSGNECIELSADGTVKAVKEGTAEVKVTAVNAYGEVKPSTTITVTVTEQHLTEEDLGFTTGTAGVNDADENGVHQVRIDEKNPHIELVCSDKVTDDVFVSYSVKEGSEEIIAVDEDGNLTFMQPGEGTIVLTVVSRDGAGNEVERTLEYVINVYEIPLTGIEFAEDSKDVTITEGSEKTISIVFNPTDTTDKVLTWSSSDPTIATVIVGEDGKAIVKALKVGEVTIKAVSASGLEAVTTVKVTAKPAGSDNKDDNKTDTNKDKNQGGAVATGDAAQPIMFGIAILAAFVVIFAVLRKNTKEQFKRISK